MASSHSSRGLTMRWMMSGQELKLTSVQRGLNGAMRIYSSATDSTLRFFDKSHKIIHFRTACNVALYFIEGFWKF